MNEEEKNLSIVSQVAGKITGHVVQSDAAIAAVRDGVFAEIHAAILCVLLDKTDSAPSAPAPLASVTEHPAAAENDAAVQAVLNSIPDSTLESAPIQHAAGAPTQISHTSPNEVLFEDALVHNPDKWWDNTREVKASVNGGKGPDFRHKDLKNKDGKFNIAIWVNSEYSPTAPDWVWDKIGRLEDYKELVAQGKVKS